MSWPVLCVAQQSIKQKGELFFYWGYNRSAFTSSDMHFQGDNYDFILSDVKASDRPSKVEIDPYLHIGKFTIPQYNYRLGYFLSGRISVSLGMDHMKYVMDLGQKVTISGFINTEDKYQGAFSNQEILIGNRFVYLEHSDGLNYASAELDYWLPVWQSNNEKFDVQFMAGAGLGLCIPKTVAVVMDEQLDNRFHVAGWGISSKAGFRTTFFTHFFYEISAKTGYVWLPNVLTTELGSAKVDHHFGWFQVYGAFGISLPLNRKRKDDAQNH
jgi:hypothetical protein